MDEADSPYVHLINSQSRRVIGSLDRCQISLVRYIIAYQQRKDTGPSNSRNHTHKKKTTQKQRVRLAQLERNLKLCQIHPTTIG